jgi:hypothetical protein
MIKFTTAMPAGTMFHLESEDGKDILTFMPTKSYQSIVISSPELEKGAIYAVYTGGSYTGTATDNLYTDGQYSPGSNIINLTISDLVTSVGSSDGMAPGKSFPGGR